MNRRTARRAPTAPPPAAPVYLGYEALIRHHQLRVPPLRSVSVAVDRTVERRIIAADGQERVELPPESATILVKSPQPLWLYAYFDATELCEFILECVKRCVEEDLQDEVAYLRAHDTAVRALEQWLDMRQSQLNTLIDVIVQGHGKLSRAKRKLAEGLSDDEVQRIEKTVADSFAPYFQRQAS